MGDPKKTRETHDGRLKSCLQTESVFVGKLAKPFSLLEREKDMAKDFYNNAKDERSMLWCHTLSYYALNGPLSLTQTRNMHSSPYQFLLNLNLLMLIYPHFFFRRGYKYVYYYTLSLQEFYYKPSVSLLPLRRGL